MNADDVEHPYDAQMQQLWRKALGSDSIGLLAEAAVLTRVEICERRDLALRIANSPDSVTAEQMKRYYELERRGSCLYLLFLSVRNELLSESGGLEYSVTAGDLNKIDPTLQLQRVADALRHLSALCGSLRGDSPLARSYLKQIIALEIAPEECGHRGQVDSFRNAELNVVYSAEETRNREDQHHMEAVRKYVMRARKSAEPLVGK